MPGIHSARRLSTAPDNDDLLAEVDAFRTQLNITTNNLAILRGTNDRLTNRISQLETSLEDKNVQIQGHEKEVAVFRRQLRVNNSEITRLKTEKNVLEKDYEDLSGNFNEEREERKRLMEKVAELEEQTAAALHLHVLASERQEDGAKLGSTLNSLGNKSADAHDDLLSRLRDTEEELDAVVQERDWLEKQLEKLIFAKDGGGTGNTLDVDLLHPRLSMSSMRFSKASNSRPTSRLSTSKRKSLGAELGRSEGVESGDDSQAESDGFDDNGSFKKKKGDGIKFSNIHHITNTADDVGSENEDAKSTASHDTAKAAPLTRTESRARFRSRSRNRSSFSERDPSIAASIRSRMSTVSTRSRRTNNMSEIPLAPATAVAVFHELEKSHDLLVSRLENDIVTLSTDLEGEIMVLQHEVDAARAERDECLLQLEKLATELSLAKAREEDAKAAALAASAAAVAAQESQGESREQIAEAEDNVTILEIAPPVQEIPSTVDVPASTKALEAELLVLREKDEARLSEVMKLKSEVDVLTRNIREKDTLIKAETVRLESQLRDAIRGNKKLKEDSEFDRLNIDNLEDELDRAREILRRQAKERKECIAELTRLRKRVKELEDAEISKRPMTSPTPENEPAVLTVAETTPEIVEADSAAVSELKTDSRDLKLEKPTIEEPVEESDADPVPDAEHQLESEPEPEPKPELDPEPKPELRPKSGLQAKPDVLPPVLPPKRKYSISKSSVTFSPSVVSYNLSAVSYNNFSSVSYNPTSLSYNPDHERIKGHRRKHRHHRSHGHRKKRKDKEKEKEKEKPDPISVIPENPKEQPIFADTIRHSRRGSMSSRKRSATASTVAAATAAIAPLLARTPSPSPERYPPSPLPPTPTPPPRMRPLNSPVEPIEPLEPPKSKSSTPEDESTTTRTRAQTLPLSFQRAPQRRPSANHQTFSSATADKTYWKDLLVGGYALPPHEYSKFRRAARKNNMNLQITVTPTGIVSNARVGTGAPIGCGGYADGAETTKTPRATPRGTRRTTDGNFDYTKEHDNERFQYDSELPGQGRRGSWWEDLFR